jgi:hypothetical protein
VASIQLNLTPQVDDLLLVDGIVPFVQQIEDIQCRSHEDSEHLVKKALRRFAQRISAESHNRRERLALMAVSNVLADLAKIGWQIRVEPDIPYRSRIIGEMPQAQGPREDRRRQLLAARAEALRDPGVRTFVGNMERERRHKGKAVSIFTLMRDGSDLAAVAADPTFLQSGCRPYLQVVTEKGTCEFTGLRLNDIWRYFRLTWANAPRDIPARQLRFLVRDAAAAGHPVAGIGELSGAAVKVGPRDRHIGWDADAFPSWWRSENPDGLRKWLLGVIENVAREVYIADFVEEGVISSPLEACSGVDAVAELRRIAGEAKAAHLARTGVARKVVPSPTTDWVREACAPLFRSKRAERLAQLLELWSVLAPLRESTSSETLQTFLSSPDGSNATAKVIRLAKSRLQGTAIADLTVCGAIPPYNELLMGKLVALMAVSPEIVAAYRSRYEGVPSIIASSMAGRPIVRPADLVLVSTTGLYGVRPSQYDRLSMPAESIGAAPGAALRYVHLDAGTMGWGTFHFSDKTVGALQKWLIASTGQRRVTYSYGEGANPRLRLLREALASLGLKPEELLFHGLSKSLYVCSLVNNPRRYLLGMDTQPDYILPSETPRDTTNAIAAWWLQRWVKPRIARDEVLTRVRRASLTRPVRHPARVELPDEEEQIRFLESW